MVKWQTFVNDQSDERKSIPMFYYRMDIYITISTIIVSYICRIFSISSYIKLHYYSLDLLPMKRIITSIVILIVTCQKFENLNSNLLETKSK